MTPRFRLVIAILVGLVVGLSDVVRMGARQVPTVKEGLTWVTVAPGPTMTVTAYYDVLFTADYPDDKTVCVNTVPTKCITAGRLKAIVAQEGTTR